MKRRTETCECERLRERDTTQPRFLSIDIAVVGTQDIFVRKEEKQTIFPSAIYRIAVFRVFSVKISHVGTWDATLIFPQKRYFFGPTSVAVASVCDYLGEGAAVSQPPLGSSLSLRRDNFPVAAGSLLRI